MRVKKGVIDKINGGIKKCMVLEGEGLLFYSRGVPVLI